MPWSSHPPAGGSILRGQAALVTGAGGFIGSHLVHRLVEEGAFVRAFVRYTSRGDRGWLDVLPSEVRAEVEVVAGDLRDLESVKGAMAGIDLVFHLGAQIAIPYSHLNPRDFVETNIVGTLNVALAARDEDVQRLVHTSTSEVYGSARVVPITEEHPVEPQSPYAASKLGADKLVDAFRLSYGLPATILRPFNTYGPRQSARAIVPTIVAQALCGEKVRLGSLEPRRDLTYVSDTVAGFVAAATAPGAVGRTIQLGTGRDVSVLEILELVGEALGRPLTPEHDPSRLRPPASEVDLLISAPELAREVLGWTPQVGLADGLRRTIEWIEANANRLHAERYVI
jgi:NAD dependent epimerase/dehydratase